MDIDSTYEAWSEASAACLDAYRMCVATARRCPAYTTDLDATVCVQTLDDCADANLLLANMLARHSPHAPQASAFCAEITRRTADTFSRFEHEDPHLRMLFAACQRVVRVCNELLAERQSAEPDARDEALEETFPASDATPVTTRL